MIPLDHVSCYSSYAYAVEPRAFEELGRTHSVARIERAWIEPGERHFLVRDEEDRRIELVYQVLLDRWSMQRLSETSRVETSSTTGVGL
ncbi:MAG: hypothetical protein ACM3JD_05750 [Rudaea sp.]